MSTTRRRGIDTFRLFFACLIPLLHIGFAGALPRSIAQYVARIGVPFFFSVSGMFLSESVERRGELEALKRYTLRIGRLLAVWLAIYTPLLVLTGQMSLRLLFFRTPAYLWYLTALLVASVPFCLVRNRELLYTLCLVLYAIGTAMGGSWKWAWGGVPQFDALFITTRNGVFFGLPMMCVGERAREKEGSPRALGICGALLFAEITFVGIHALPEDDRSMYYTLPLFIYWMLPLIREWEPQCSLPNGFAGLSTAIYCMQYGVITTTTFLLARIRWTGEVACWLEWILAIAVPSGVYYLLRRARVGSLLW